jgi:ubiquinone/menaquinone biosynthesis C-methylase UbiE
MSPESIRFDRAAGFYDETRGFPPGEERHIAALIARAAHLTPSSRVLEVGVGTGRIALPLAGHVGAIVGIDLARPMLERLLAKRDGEPVRVVEGDVTRLPLASGVFDAAVAVHVFHLVPAWPDALREVARALRPGGRLVSGWNEGDRGMGESALWNAWDAAVGAITRRNVGVPRERYRSFLEDEGWRPAGDLLVHRYATQHTPRGFFDQIERRVWSSFWRLSDADLARGLAAVRAAMRELDLDPDQPLAYVSRFSVQAYLPPDR